MFRLSIGMNHVSARIICAALNFDVETSASESKFPEGKEPEIVIVSTEKGGTYDVAVSVPVRATGAAPARWSSKRSDTLWAAAGERVANITKRTMGERSKVRMQKCAAMCDSEMLRRDAAIRFQILATLRLAFPF